MVSPDPRAGSRREAGTPGWGAAGAARRATARGWSGGARRYPGPVRGRRRTRGTVAVLLAVAALVAAGCSPTTSNRAGSEDRAAQAREATRQLEAAQRKELGCKNVVMSEEDRTTSPPEHLVLLTDAYAVAEPCWDKIVFTFEPTGADMPPGYSVGYRKGPFTEGAEGQFPVDMLGNAYLAVTFTPAASTDPSNEVQTYKGRLLLLLEDMHHTEMVRKLIDGDGTVMWLIGLDEKRPFTVDAANQPPRVTVYIAR